MGGEVEWRDPDTLSFAMPHQGVLPMHFVLIRAYPRKSAVNGFCFSDHARSPDHGDHPIPICAADAQPHRSATL
jgi:hypothetical protein